MSVGYTPYYPDGWEDSPNTSTPIIAAALNNMETGIEDAFETSTSLGGDLSGTLPDPTVTAVQGVTVSTTAPTTGQVLTATSSTAADWQTPSGGVTYPISIADGGTGETTASAALTALGGFATSTSLGGGLSGTLPDPTVAKVQAVTVSTTAPSAGQVLTATSATAADWATPATAPVTSVNGETGAVTVTEVSGITVSGTPSSGQVLTATSSTAADWATSPSAPVTSVNGETGAVTVTEVSGITVSGTPTAGMVLTATSATAADWATTGGGGSPSGPAGGDLGSSYPDPTVVGIQGVAVSSTAPTTGQVLTATSATAADWATPATAPVTSVNGETGAVTVTEVSSVTVSGTPTSGQVLTATSGTAADWQTPSTVTYPISIADGGTGETTASAALTALGGFASSTSLGGGLSGTLPDPTVAKVQGVTVSTTAPTTGQVLTATSSTAADWATPTTAPVTSVNGETGAVTVTEISGVTVSGTPSAAQVLMTASATAADWQPLDTSWNSLPTLQNGWTAWSGHQNGYRLLPDGDLELTIGLVPGTLTDGTLLFTLPSGYYPPGEVDNIIGLNCSSTAEFSSSSPGGFPALAVSAGGSGEVQIYWLPSNTTAIYGTYRIPMGAPT